MLWLSPEKQLLPHPSKNWSTVDRFVLPETLTVMLNGSSSKLPVLPIGARVSTLASKARVCLPDTSTKPPFPPCWPPRSLMLP